MNKHKSSFRNFKDVKRTYTRVNYRIFEIPQIYRISINQKAVRSKTYNKKKDTIQNVRFNSI